MNIYARQNRRPIFTTMKPADFRKKCIACMDTVVSYPVHESKVKAEPEPLVGAPESCVKSVHCVWKIARLPDEVVSAPLAACEREGTASAMTAKAERIIFF